MIARNNGPRFHAALDFRIYGLYDYGIVHVKRTSPLYSYVGPYVITPSAAIPRRKGRPCPLVHGVSTSNPESLNPMCAVWDSDNNMYTLGHPPLRKRSLGFRFRLGFRVEGLKFRSFPLTVTVTTVSTRSYDNNSS